MKLRLALRRSIARFAALVLLPASVAGITTVGASASKAATASSGCQLNGPVKHVIYLVFDNVHFRRDRPNVPSDLEQMPHLLNFLTSNGTLLTNDHTILISHTAGGILSSLTGLYPDRQGQTVSNGYAYFDKPATPQTDNRPTGNPQFTTSFKYWTDLVDDNPPVPAGAPPGTIGTPRDSLPNMVTDNKKMTPAPWVPYTRAGCDFGGVSTANIELENTGTGAFGDMTEAFGANSDEWKEAKQTPTKAQADFVGIAIHCGNGGGICDANPRNRANRRDDKLPDEQGGYSGFKALYGAKYVDPAINNGNPCVNDLYGQPVTDSAGNCGFPGFDSALAKNTLGYVAQMQESGVPVTYAYISDAHDNHTLSRASGPGEADYKAQLAAYDDAFSKFFARLTADGITKANTLFAVTADEGDHFAGGTGTPQPDGSLAYSHTACVNLSGCPANQIGEVSLNLKKVLPAPSTSFSFAVHSDSAPTFYVKGNPSPSDADLRTFERSVGNLEQVDPYVSTSPTPVFVQLADPAGEKALHMVNADPQRTPNFVGFGNPDFFMTANDFLPFCGANPCVDPKFAWNHGDIQPEIANNWLGLVGPGVKKLGIDSKVWTDHTNVRPTIMELAGLKDDYVNDGRVLIEVLKDDAVAKSLREHRGTMVRLGSSYEQVNAPFGQFGMDLLKASTRALKSGSASNDTVYASIETKIDNLTSQRDALAGQIRAALNAAAFGDRAINEEQAQDWIRQGESLVDQADALAAG